MYTLEGRNTSAADDEFFTRVESCHSPEKDVCAGYTVEVGNAIEVAELTSLSKFDAPPPDTMTFGCLGTESVEMS